MAIEINDLGSTISILNDGEYTIITKQDASIALNGSIVALIDFSGQRYEYNFADVSIPLEASGADLAATLNDYLQTSGGGGGSVGTLQQVTNLGNSTTNDIEFGTGKGILLNNDSRLREGTTDAGTGGSKGIAQICAVGYELKWEAGSQYVMDGNGLLIREVNHKFNIAPTVTNDDSEGFYVGSRWILDDGTIYTCTDASTGAAVWAVQFPIINLKVSLSAAQIKTANSVPVNIGLAASGAGFYYRVVNADVRVDYNSIQFTNTTLYFGSHSTGASQREFNQLAVAYDLFKPTIESVVLTSSIVENGVINIWSEADSAVGNSTIDCYISVQKVKL